MQFFRRLHMKFTDPQNSRFEVPLEIKGADASAPSDPLYDIQFFNDPSFYFKVGDNNYYVILDICLRWVSLAGAKLLVTVFHF